MATDDRKRRILDHLSRSTTGADYIPQKTAANCGNSSGGSGTRGSAASSDSFTGINR